LGRGVLARPWNSESSATLRSESDKTLNLLTPREDRAAQEIVSIVKEISQARGLPMATIAIAWCLHKGVNPIVGLNSKARMDEAVKAVKVSLTKEEIARLEEHYVPKRELPIY
jgi:aryl-alcohol dehydrogenase-like predicted oxidoreductase